MLRIAHPQQAPTESSKRAARSGRRGPAEDPSAAAERMRSIARSHRLAPSVKQLAQVALATLLVAGCPVAVVWWLRSSGTVSSAVFGLIIGMALSLGGSYVGCLVWEKRPGSEDLLFSELMIWGYLHRWHTQRRLASALNLLGPVSEARRRALDGLSTKDQAKLLEGLVAEMETRDPYLHGHSRRVARHSWMIARHMGLSRAQVARIRTAAAIHDVGKIETPKAILHKPGPLTIEQYEVVKRHPGDGARMTEVLRDAELTSMVRHHHERLDGTGYPDGLSGEEIPLGARIIAVADTFDAITSTRPYRAASPHKKAIDILKNEAGTRLDPAVVRAFCSHYAGRRPLAMWSSVTGLPERVVSWLGGSLASVASAAKVIAVAALIGGAAATSSTLALPPAKPDPTKATRSSMLALQAGGVHWTRAKALVPTHPVAMPRSRHGNRVRHAVIKPSAHSGSPTFHPVASAGGGAAGGQSGKSGGSPEGTSGKTGEPQGKGKPEEPPNTTKEPTGKGKPEEPARKGKPEEHPAKGKPEEPPAKGKPEEPPAKGKPEEPAGKGKPEEAAENGKSEEAHGKAKAGAKTPVEGA
jgi:HD-GYP domain-containing protein (c-di-GMP phosphodiesterase class II)